MSSISGTQMRETSEDNKNASQLPFDGFAVSFRKGKSSEVRKSNKVQPFHEEVILDMNMIQAKDAPAAAPLASPLGATKQIDDILSQSLLKSALTIESLETKRDTHIIAEREKFWEETHLKEMNPRKRIIMENFKSLREALDTNKRENTKASIQKLPFILGDNYKNFKNYYVPKMVSIGPYHHDDHNLRMTQNLKLKFAQLFIKKHGLNDEALYSQIEKNIKKLREYYEQEAIKGFEDDQLAWIFLVDGCTILCYIYCAMRKEHEKSLKDLKIKVDCLALVKQDLFLLENQLPFEVLELIMSNLTDKGADDMKKAINEFIFERIKAPEEKHDEQKQREIGSPTHLLDLLRTRILEEPVKEDERSCSYVQHVRKIFVEFINGPLDRIQDLIEYMGKAFENSPSSETQDLHFFRNVEELKSVGIRLRASKTSRLTDITFNLGTLKLPPIRVDESTASKFLNLIAYEMCPNFINNFGVCSYIVFLDAFIDRAQDVKQLRDKQILHNALGSDEEVAKLFNVISTNLVPDPTKYSDIKSAIQRRYENKLVTWIAQFNHQHFTSPWSVLAFLAAIMALALSVVQTTYTVMGHYRS